MIGRTYAFREKRSAQSPFLRSSWSIKSAAKAKSRSASKVRKELDNK
jgi:hypothetical protein